MKHCWMFLFGMILCAQVCAQNYSDEVTLLHQDDNSVTVRATATAAKKKDAAVLATKSAFHTLFHSGIPGVKNGVPMVAVPQKDFDYRFFSESRYISYIGGEVDTKDDEKIAGQYRVTVQVNIRLKSLCAELQRNNLSLQYNVFAIEPQFELSDVLTTEGLMQEVSVVKGELTLTAKNSVDGTMYYSMTIPVKGSGVGGEEKAMKAMIGNIKSTDTKFTRFIRTARQKIQDYYAANCATILQKAQNLYDRKRYGEAVSYLSAISDALPCYEQASVLLKELADYMPAGPDTVVVEKVVEKPVEVEEIYWQKVRDKTTNVEHYDYSVKYPFSESEQRQLVAEFEKLDAEKVAQYKALERKIQDIEAVEEIKSAITELNTLNEYFFDEVRITEVRGLTERYKQLYDALTVTGTFLEEGKYKCQILLDGNPVRVSALPKVTSNCAAQLNVRPSEGAFVISYDATDCLPEEDNFLDILFRISGKRLNHKAYIREAGGAGTATFSVVPEGKLILTADSVVAASRKIFNVNIRLTLNNRGGTAFGLKALELHIPELSTPIVFDDIDAVYKTKGILQVKALAEGEFTALEKKKSAFSFVQGSMTLVNPQSGAVERVKLSLPYVTNWE